MPIEVLFAMFGAAFLHASWNIIIKSGENKFFEAGLNTLGAGLCVIFFLPFLELPKPEAFKYILLSATIHIAYYYNVAVAYKSSEISYSYSLMRGFTPLLTSIVLFLLGTHIGFGSWIGIALLSISVISLAFESILQKRFNIRANISVFLLAFIIMSYTIVDGYGVRLNENAINYSAWFFFFNIFPTNIIIILSNGKEYIQYAKKRFKFGLLGGFASLISYGVALWAMTKAPIAVVASLRETSVIFAMLLATIFLKEKLTKIKVLAVVLVVLGTYFIKKYT